MKGVVDVSQLAKENDIMRTILAHSPLPCLYCALSASDMGRCRSGFPGCGRADDMMCAILPKQFQYLEKR